MKKIISILFVVAALVSCQNGAALNGDIEPPHDEANAVYFWKTVCSLDGADKAFLSDNNVKRAYVRFFDIVPDEYPTATDKIVPNASLIMKDSIPVDEIVPTIFITQEALGLMDGKYDYWASKIVERVWAMCSYNELPSPKEIQLDCDWTESSRDKFFELCKGVKELMVNNDSDALVSATIRLHQLSQQAPPVDYGVLMLYNTGSFRNVSESNSIISKENIEPYLKKLSSYPLHLDVAYPTYNWQLLFRNNKFVGLIRGELPLNTKELHKIDHSHLKALSDMQVEDLKIKKGDIIRIEKSDFNTIKDVKDLVEKSLDDVPHSNIIYHLDSKNLRNYTKDEIKTIYR